jgi:hypothetical protein
MKTSVEIKYRKDLYAQLDTYYPRPFEMWGAGPIGHRVFSKDIGDGLTMAFDFWIPMLTTKPEDRRHAVSDELRLRIIEILNTSDDTMNEFPLLRNNEGSIEAQLGGDTWYSIIVIRGWGNLTAQSCHGESVETAAKIQDMFAEWIIGKLTNWGKAKITNKES